MLNKSFFYPFILFFLTLAPLSSVADIVKPALVEISVKTDGTFQVEIRASIEALLTGINSRYKNTRDAPNAQAYDDFRVLPPEQLRQAFRSFEKGFLQEVKIQFDNEPARFQITTVDIPEPGYVKVPRISLIIVEGEVPTTAQSLNWYYPSRFGDNAVRVRQVDEVNEKWHWSPWQWLKNDEVSQPFSLTEVFTQQTFFQVLTTYLVSGFEHILPKGLDHILFILGIFLLSTHIRPLLWQVTMFTVAHTITLGLSMNGVLNLPANIVEPLIALSIAYIGIENIVMPKLHKSRLFIVFIFGLLHGLGFASVLSDFGMPENDFATALISFNIGVEIAQVAIIFLAWFFFAHLLRNQLANEQQYRKVVVIPGSLLIALTGLYWTYDRIQF
ncbi:MAG: HupE/UreJ family protein [gamma proteobacterium symbiont of Bathyaustriella thionipta]|nr:HupE/UreJ family protein [gamma proteobacterium symbiont of Bathyaustriella thionipta]MCU7951007.1 HupE/UreJ family protein [gamma proteobacterium symbiont of Bathyaustriella thionipta]MCU7952501.1 HupE/UreJ family protein [gamma proteobacterium symbiont of Bathyaustriella thionipta]MCU7957514.1 HupE/UreJ family protein [gamma proteobacterium symbiont of Bathyaustriella thionipta]MCU7966103.1 HupE/UreJ family protein [gamma proteobacterium symbiont of Bathyaustriella thionipta]